jgi:hypothetical protein
MLFNNLNYILNLTNIIIILMINYFYWIKITFDDG